ncbi:S16 family serine protease [Methanothermococcus sp.]|uniref:S16 family serine protease n=1 Tax=Methanothermococcus sp. TaxID=2614238 RepID=UPI0025EE0C52|nr:S16 family serine protease [Methanothermococcus sp.]
MKKYFLLFLLLTIPISVADVSIVAPAVAETDYGYIGAPVNMDVKVLNGSGHVYMDTMPMTQLDMQGSARIAAKVAFDICGKNQKDYDVYYVVRSNVPVIGGPSAGATLCVATIAALNNWSLNKNVMMTGMINPDGSIGPVGGILEKIKAAKSMNVKYFLIPYGERYVSADDLTDNNNTVDVVKYGKSLGINVIEVKSIYDAVYYFTNHKIVEKDYKSNPVINSIYSNMMKNLSDKVLKKVNNNYEYVKDRLEYEYEYNIRMNYNLKHELDEKLKTSKANINLANNLYLNKSYYAATSKAFGALINLESINTTLNYIDSDDGKDYVKGYLLSIQNKLNNEKNLIDNENLSKNNIEYIVASKSRIYEAEELIDSAWKEYYNNKPLSAIKYGAYAKLRGDSAIWWLYLNNKYNKNIKNRAINKSDLKYLAQEYLDNSEVVVLYSSMIFPTDLANNAMKNLDDAKEYYNQRAYLLSISKSIDAYVYATTSLNYMEDTSYLKELAEKKINLAENYGNGIIPISALGYYEYANTFNDKMSKILYYKYSMAYAQMDIDILNEINENTSNVLEYNIVNRSIPTNVNNITNNNTNSNFGNNKITSISDIIFLIIGLFCGIFVGYFLKKRENNN